MNIAEWLNHARTLLAESGCADCEVDSRWIAEDVLGLSWASLKFEGDHAVTPDQLKKLESCLVRRTAGEPLQYILGRTAFMGLSFAVDPRVLIPRQDTETLVEAALIELRRHPECAALDLCTGSGCVGLSLKSLAPGCEMTLTDISRDALEVAKQNAKALGIEARIRCGDLFGAVNHAKFDVIVANPPYIPSAQLPTLQREIRYEPRGALDGGEDGLEIYRRIALGAGSHLNPGGAVLLEVGMGQADAVANLLKAHLPVSETGTVKDLNDIERVVWAHVN